MTTKTKLAASTAITLADAPPADVASIIRLANVADAKGAALQTARHDFTDYALSVGMTPDYFSAPKSGSNDPVHFALYAAFKHAAAATVAKEAGHGRKMKLTAENLAKFLDKTVQAKVILQGYQKAGQTEKGKPASWNASVTSKMSDWRDWLNKAMAEGATKEKAARKNDVEYLKDKAADMLARVKRLSESDNPDGSFDPALAAAFTKDFTNFLVTYKLAAKAK